MQTPARSWLWLLLAALALQASPALAAPQVVSLLDAAGETVVVSITSNARGVLTTRTLSTVTATPTTPTTTSTSTSSVVSIGRAQAPPPDAGTSTAPPTTYLVYWTVNGVQTSGYSTFYASFAPTPSPMQPSPGVILDLSSYLASAAPTSGTSKKSSAVSDTRTGSGARGALAAAALTISLLLGAMTVF